MKLGKISIDFPSRVFLAPISGFTDLPFRMQCLKYGAGLVVVPLVNAKAITGKTKAALNVLKTTGKEHPLAVQLFGTDIGLIKKAVKIAREETNCDMIDFNMGCPEKKILSQKAGAALLRRPAKIKEIVEALKSSSDVPVSIKIRIGGSLRSLNALRNAQIIEKAGADMLIVHGRTIMQGYSGKSCLNIIKEIKENVSLPVVGNGDVWNEGDAKKMLEFTKCDAIMVGRGALGKPHLFEKLNYYLDNGRAINREYGQISEFFEYLGLCKKFNETNFPRIKKHAISFTRGIINGTPIRKRISESSSVAQINEIMNSITNE